MHSKLLQSCPTLCDPMNCEAHQVPLSRGFSRQDSWSERPCPSLGKEKTAAPLIARGIQGICVQPSQPAMWEGSASLPLHRPLPTSRSAGGYWRPNVSSPEEHLDWCSSGHMPPTHSIS